jgi:hypothetical protein
VPGRRRRHGDQHRGREQREKTLHNKSSCLFVPGKEDNLPRPARRD